MYFTSEDFLFKFLSGVALCICLKGEVKNEVLTLNCKIDNLRADVDFYKDGTRHGFCPGPTPNSKTIIICNEDNMEKNINITQDLSTNITTVVAKNTDSFVIYGLWQCKHGEKIEQDSFFVTNSCNDHEGKRLNHFKCKL